MPNVDFEEWRAGRLIGMARSGRAIRDVSVLRGRGDVVSRVWCGHLVWWSDRFGPCGPNVDAVSGPLGYERDPIRPGAEYEGAQ